MKITMPIASLVYLLAQIALVPQAHAREWQFAAFVDGKPMGQHSFVLNESGQGASAERELVSTAKFKVKLLFINAYSYDHIAREKWQGDCLLSLESKTEENRETTVVKTRPTSGGLEVDNGKNKQVLSTCPMTFAYWNPQMLQQKQLLNPQTGEWLDVTVKPLVNETITVRGQAQETRHYTLEAPKMKIDLWYNMANEWVALKSVTPEGHVVTYQLK